ncbi:hypothetical protein [Priestia megaterium]|uniref:hypothetical protein n=1 Tax=Priestia megaterium TaxID=1404 RepID=UPI0025A3C4A3|nr:hypothetical protein [Priestia megaterium]MDM8151634.1 hypothetical protein [Priestia megaterium]
MYNNFDPRGYYIYPCYPVYQSIPHEYKGYYPNTYRDTEENLLIQRPIIPPDDALSEEYRPNDVIKLVEASAEKNGNFRRRCGCDSFGSCPSSNHGESFVTIDYKGKYNVRVWIKHYGKENYGKGDTFEKRWDSFQRAPASYNHFTSPIISGPGKSGGYFQNGNNNTPGLRTGTLGLEAYDKGTGNWVWRVLYHFDGGFGSWGNQWLRCGHDYLFRFQDV